MSTVATSTPKTPEQKHAAARQSQTMGRFGGVLILMLFLGLPTLAVGMILYGMTTRDRRRYAILLIGMLLGMAVVGLSYPVLLAHTHSIAAAWPLYQPAVSQYFKAPSLQHWQALQPFFTAFTPQIIQLWLIALPLAPCVAVYLESTRVKALPELRADKQRQEQQREALQRREAARTVAQAPEQVAGKPVLGVPLGGALPDWRIRDWVTYPAELLNRHAVIIGGSGTGLTQKGPIALRGRYAILCVRRASNSPLLLRCRRHNYAAGFEEDQVVRRGDAALATGVVRGAA
jgi:hypothetical protein